MDRLAEDRDGKPDVARVEELRELGRLVGLLELQWLRELAELDARGAAGAEQGTRAPSTASWLQARLGMSAAEASSHVQIAPRALGLALRVSTRARDL